MCHLWWHAGQGEKFNFFILFSNFRLRFMISDRKVVA